MTLLADSPVSMDSIFGFVSFLATIYFWVVQANRERPDLRIFQLQDFRAHARRVQGRDGIRRLGIQQLGGSGVLIANNSTRQNSIVMFECFFQHNGRTYHGDWGYVGDDAPPWNIGPESSIGLALACFFDVPEDFEVPDNLAFVVNFVTVSGAKFGHEFQLQAPRLSTAAEPLQAAA